MQLAAIMRTGYGSFGAELYAARIRKGFTQAEVAAKARLGRGYYSQLENSRKGPPSETALIRIVQALGLGESDGKRLVASAIAERCTPAPHVKALSPAVRQLLVCIFDHADRITPATAFRIETILSEE